jgi:hypothetical protein
MGDWPKSSLHDHPDIAAKVGLVVADYALLEYFTFVIFALISGESPDASFVAFYGLRHTHLREELTYKHAAKLDADLEQAIKRVWKRFKAAAHRRTEIAHCSFLSDGKTVARFRLYGTEPRIEPTDESVFKRTFTQYRTLGKDLGMLATQLAPYPGAIVELARQLPLGRHQETQRAWLGSPRHPANYGSRETIECLGRLKLLDWTADKWMREGTVPPSWKPPWRVQGVPASEWFGAFLKTAKSNI